MAAPADLTARPQKLAVHVHHRAGATPLVQIVHVLGDEQQLAGPSGLEPGQREMRGVRPDRLSAELPTPRIIEAMNGLRIAGEGLRRRELRGSVTFP